MWRFAIVGAACFLLGVVSAPKAANDGELSALLCKRFNDMGGEKQRMYHWEEAMRLSATGKTPEWARHEAEFSALTFLRTMSCGPKP
jgi:hypothetical protein